MKIVQLASFLNAFVDSSDRMLSAHNEMLLRVERARSQAVLRPGDDKSRVVGREREKEERHVLREKEKEKEKGRERQREGTSVKSNGSKCSEERESDSRTAVKSRDKDKEREKDKDRVDDGHIIALRSDVEYELERNDSPVAHPALISKSASPSVSAAAVTHIGSGVGVGAGAGADTGTGGGAGSGAEGTAWLSKEALDNLNTEYSDSDSLLSAFSHSTKTKRKGLNKKKAGVSSDDTKPNASGISLSLLKENAGDNERVIEIDNESEDNNKNSKSKSENKNESKDKSESKNGNDGVGEDQEEVSLCSDDSFESALEDPTPALAPDTAPSSSSSGPNPDPSRSHTRTHSDGGSKGKGRGRGRGDDGSVEEEEEESDGDDSEGESEDDNEGESDSDSDSESGTSGGAMEEAEKFNELIRETESLRSQLMSNIRLVESDRSKADVLHMLQLELSGCEESLRALKIAYIESLMLANTADIDHENGRGRSKEDEDAAEGTYSLNYFPYYVHFFVYGLLNLIEILYTILLLYLDIFLFFYFFIHLMQALEVT